MRAAVHIVLTALFAVFASAAGALELPAFKDKLFAYPGIISQSDGGDYRVVDYDEMRDINGRDEVPERRVHGNYVSLRVNREQRDLVLDTAVGKVRHYAVGKADNANLIVMYLHGQGGSRQQGVNDFTFGGNFNRIKNLVTAADGLYLVPDFPDFDQGGAKHLAALLHHYAARSPQARIVIACGSMGGSLCWWLGRDRRIAERLGGLMLMGSLWDPGFFDSPAFRMKVPVFLGQGSRDKVFPAERVEAFYREIRQRGAGYPVRMVRFEGGSHGTPIRMIDWRETINWMLSAK